MSISLKGLPKIKKNSSKRVGRGIGSGNGKTSGRGVKGQKSRTGHHSVAGFEGGQTPVHMILPKRGFNNINRKETEAITIKDVLAYVESKKLDSSSDITKEALAKVGLIKSKDSTVKLIMSKDPKVSAKIKVVVDLYSQKAKAFS